MADSFAVSLKSYHVRKHMFDMVESDYYRIYSDNKILKVRDGYLYITRTPHTHFITVYTATGEHYLKIYDAVS